MSDKLTYFETEILKALRKHKDKNASELFSMKEFYKNDLFVEVPWNRFKEIVILLEDSGYIKKFPNSGSFDDPFGCYEIAPKGLRYLRNLEQKK